MLPYLNAATIIAMKSEHEEILDLVDENDQVIGKKSRADIYNEGLTNFRVVNVFIKNSKGELWIPRRTAHKKLFPLYLDMSAAGHVESGETYEEAAKKEVAEEINVDFDAVPTKYLGKCSPKEHGVSSYGAVYEITLDEAPDYNPDDFVEYYWLTPEALLKKIEEGEKAKSDIPILLTEFYL